MHKLTNKEIKNLRAGDRIYVKHNNKTLSMLYKNTASVFCNSKEE